MAEKILIVDDDPEIVESIRVVLQCRGYDVCEASSAEEGLETLRRERPSLVILDVMMATVDAGFEASRAIRRDPELAKVPIVILTALKERTGFDFGPEAGDSTWLPVEAYLDKPIEPDRLLETVERVLEESRR